MPTNQNNERVDNITHLNAMKVQNGGVVLRGAYLAKDLHTAVKPVREWSADDQYYNLNGQKVDRPVRGIYIKNGQKVIVK